MGTSLSSIQQMKMGKIDSSSDVLINIIGRLSLKEQFASISISQLFHFAAIEALKQHHVLVVTTVNDKCRKEPFFGKSNVKDCGCGRHKLKKKDIIDPLFFKYPKRLRKILRYLPGIKAVHIDRYVQEIYRHLSQYCPNMECLVVEGKFDKLTSQPEVTHFTGEMDAAFISQLPQLFPKLTSLSLKGCGLYEGDFNEKSFREGITRLKLSYMGNKWPTVFKSPAMNTVKELHIDSGFGDRPFVAPNLISIHFVTETCYCEPKMHFILKSLCSSPLLQKLIFEGSCSNHPQRVPVSLFTSFNRLRVIEIPALVDINKILVIVCRNNPLLEDVYVHSINGDDGYVALQEFSCLRNFKSLQIVNIDIGDKGLSQEQLLEFVAENQVEGQLRFLFTLYQSKHFPGSKVDSTNDWTEVDWNGIKWMDFCNFYVLQRFRSQK